MLLSGFISQSNNCLLAWNECVYLQCENLVNRGATAQLHQVAGARLQSGKRVSISNPNSPRDELVACGITSKLASYSVVWRYSNINQERCRCHRSWLQSTESAKESRPPCLRSSFPRLVNLDDKPTLCVFTPSVNQSRYCITLNYYCAVIAHISDIASHFCKKHAEVKQAKRIQTRRSCIC